MKKQQKQKRGRIEPDKRMKMAENHTWEAPEGYKIMVIDRGAVSFNFPASWIVAKLEPHLEIHNAEPPNDEARLSVSFWRTPPGIDWTELPLAPLLAKASGSSKLDILARSEIIRFPRSDLEIVWTEHRFMDPVEHREAYSRIAMARGWDVHVLITFDFWVSDAEKLAPIWDEALRSLQLGRHIDDPTKGIVKH